MQNNEPLITIAQYSMSTARGLVLESTAFDSLEHALQLPCLCTGTLSIEIKTNRQVEASVINSDVGNLLDQLKQRLEELFSNEI